MNIPKISIITTTYNDIDNLKAIIQEVQNQDYTNIEHIIVDGGSKDGTIEVLKNYKSLLGDKLIYISEKDSGIYDALNKGISLASGDIIGCCFDHYTSNHVISEIVNRIEKDSSDGVHGDLVYIKDDKIVRYWKQGEGSIYKGWMPGHPTLYLKEKFTKNMDCTKQITKFQLITNL